MRLTFAVAWLFLAALTAPTVVRLVRAKTAAGVLLAFAPLALGIYFASRASAVTAGAVVESFAWAESLGVRLSFRLDGLSLLFALLVTGVGALVTTYAGGYLLDDAPARGRFYSSLLLFAGAMLGLVLADNVVLLFVFWELTSVTSFLLIGFDHEREAARRAAMRALVVTTGGGLALLAGLLIAGAAGGSFELSELAARAEQIESSPLYAVALVLILAGAFTKSAQVPFHFWLPGAMEAPTPVSAYLHSATMVNAGVYLLARTSSFMSGGAWWFYLVTPVGAATMLAGGALALRQTDLKRVLAFSTVSALGAMVMMLGLGNRLATTAALAFLLAHALYKAALFMLAGAIDHATGTRDIRRLGGLRRLMPLPAAAGAIAGVSLAGLMPTLSFVGKELMLEAALGETTGRAGAWLAFAITLAGALFFAAACVAVVRPFFTRARSDAGAAHLMREARDARGADAAHDPAAALWLPPLLLAAACVACGVFAEPVGDLLIAPAVAAATGEAAAREAHGALGLWHGLTPAFGLSVLSYFVGAGLFLLWTRSRFASAGMTVDPKPPAPLFDGARLFDSALRAVERFARAATGVVQNGYLRFYLITIISTMILLAGYALVTRVPLPPVYDAGTRARLFDLRFYEAAICFLILGAALVAVRSRSRLGAVASLGVVGTGVALVFILFSAPDLALTQVMIETLSVILFVLVLYHLPRFAVLTRTPARLRDVVIAGTGGALMTSLVLVAAGVSFSPDVAEFYAARSLPEGHGRNVVNVILVDFRGLDTLGEITVLAIAAAGVRALLKLRPRGAAGGSGTG